MCSLEDVLWEGVPEMSPTPIWSLALDFTYKVLEARSGPEVQDLLLAFARSWGFEYLVVCDLPTPGQSFKVDVCNWPEDFLEECARDLFRYDPLLRHAAQTTEPFSWSEVEWDRSRGSPEQRVMDLAASYGLKDGFVVPVVGLDGEQSLIGLAGDRAKLLDQERRALHLVCLYAHHAIKAVRKPSKHRIQKGALQDCLAYAFVGLDTDAITERTSLSAGEVRAAWKRAQDDLGVRDPMGAAVKAAVLGAINP